MGVDLLMILVMVGTQDKPFTRLLDAVNNYAKTSKEKIIVQRGLTPYESKYMEVHDFFSPDETEKLIKEADIVITHGGVGTITTALKYHKPVIAVARLKKYGEHTNDHQKQIIEKFTDNGYILELKDFDQLDDLIKEAKKFKPKEFKSNNKIFVDKLKNKIDSYLR
jgi:UDP-N-acetylglucosamine transferase subunit ALG13